MKVGWIGVGNMGKPMAKHIQEHVSEFTVCDLNQESAIDILEDGGIWAETPAECAKDKDVVFMSLPMPQDVEKVSIGESGIIESIKKNSLYGFECKSKFFHVTDLKIYNRLLKSY